MHSLPQLHLREVASDQDEAFILGLAPLFTGFSLPAWRHARSCSRGVQEALAQRIEQAEHEARLWLAENTEGTPIGFLSVSLTKDYFSGQRQAHLNELAVASGHQRQGYGRALLSAAEDWARNRGCKALSLNVFPGNTAARQLYASAGYQLDMLRLARPL